VLQELGLVEQRYQAVREVLNDGASVTDVAQRREPPFPGGKGNSEGNNATPQVPSVRRPAAASLISSSSFRSLASRDHISP
jgi:hypothetical protein